MKLIADNLSVDRGGRRVFAGLSFEAQEGTGLLVTGPNGVGKSSLLRTLAGLVTLAEGTIRLEGGVDDLAVAAHCHYFGHLDTVKPSLSVLENLGFWQRFFGTTWENSRYQPDVQAPRPALDTLGIAHTADLPAAYLSAGQRRRLSIARLLVSPRPVWLLDEPTSALDAASEQNLVAIMNRHLAAGGMIIAATHMHLPITPAKELKLEAGQ